MRVHIPFVVSVLVLAEASGEEGARIPSDELRPHASFVCVRKEKVDCVLFPTVELVVALTATGGITSYPADGFRIDNGTALSRSGLSDYPSALLSSGLIATPIGGNRVAVINYRCGTSAVWELPGFRNGRFWYSRGKESLVYHYVEGMDKLRVCLFSTDRKVQVDCHIIRLTENGSRLFVRGALSCDGRRFFAVQKESVLEFDLKNKSLATWPTPKLPEIESVSHIAGKDELVCFPASGDAFIISRTRGKRELIDFPGSTARCTSEDGRLLACAEGAGGFKLIDIYSGQLLCRAYPRRERCEISCLSISPDCKRIAAGYSTGEVVVFELWKGLGSERNPDLSKDIQTLASVDSVQAWHSMRRLLAAPERSLPLMKAQLGSARRYSAESIVRLLAGLESENFRERESAQQELEIALPAGRKLVEEFLSTTRSLEAKRRLQKVLSRDQEAFFSRTRLQQLRIAFILRVLNTSESQAVLRNLAVGLPDDPVVVEAQSLISTMK